MPNLHTCLKFNDKYIHVALQYLVTIIFSFPPKLKFMNRNKKIITAKQVRKKRKEKQNNKKQ